MRIQLLLALMLCVSACTSNVVDKYAVVENGAKSKIFIETFGQPSAALIESQQWQPVETPKLATATWYLLSSKDHSDVRYSLLQDSVSNRFNLARENGDSDQMHVSSRLEVFGPIEMGGGT